MKRTIGAVAALLAAAPVAAGTPTKADVVAVQQFLKSDNSYTPTARAEAERLAAELDKYLADEARFELEVAHIVALADNGHTALFPAQWTRRYPRSPVRLGLFADGLFIVAAPPTEPDTLGEAVVAINDVTWRKVRARYSAFQGGPEQFKDQFFPIFAEMPALLLAAGIGHDSDQLTLTLANGRSVQVSPILTPLDDAISDTPVTRSATGLVQGALPIYLQHADKPLFATTLPDLDAVYIRIDRTYGDDIPAFLNQTLEQIRANPQRNIILDLRFNLGGDLNNTRDFATELPALAQGGKVYVITAGRTFSAAISTTGYVKQAAPDKVRIVGEPLGDRLEFWAEGRMTMLPGLGALLLNATERHNYRTGCPEVDCHGSIRNHPIRVDTLDPDIEAPLTFADYVSGRDPSMDAIARDIGASQS